MTRTIFYAWQSDSAPRANRNLIEAALERARRDLQSRCAPGEVLEVVQAARGVAGAPDIPSVIFERIESATAVVADITFVAQNDERALPNPNVMIEVGYALGKLSPRRVVLVQNEAYFRDRNLPFDIRNRTVLKYTMTADVAPGAARSELTAKLTGALGDVLRDDHLFGDGEIAFTLQGGPGRNSLYGLSCEMTNNGDRRIDDWELTLSMPTAPFAAAQYGHGCHDRNRSDGTTSFFHLSNASASREITRVRPGESRKLAVDFVLNDNVIKHNPGILDAMVAASILVDGTVVRRVVKPFGELQTFTAYPKESET